MLILSLIIARNGGDDDSRDGTGFARRPDGRYNSLAMALKREDFERMVEEAVLAIPAGMREKVRNVEIVLERRPTAEQDECGDGIEGEAGDLLGLFEGLSIIEQGGDISGSLPGKITLFTQAIVDEAGAEEEVARVVRETLWHEIAHYFGFDEDDAYRLEAKWARGLE